VSGLRADRVAQASTSYDAARIRPDGVFWVEGRPDSVDVLVRWTHEHGSQDLTPEGFSVASYVHEYGGGAWAAADGVVWFCNAEDQRVYRVAAGEVRPVSPAGAVPGAIRYADLTVHPGGGWLWAVRERHEPDQVVNELVRMSAAPGAAPVVVASGWDFYSFPRPSPDGRWLAWTCWNAPQMPWDGTWLHVARVDAGGSLSEPVLVAGGNGESVFQPEWSPDGVLHFVSDRNGWWNLYAWPGSQTIPVLACEAELGVAQWEFGYSTFAFVDAGRIAVVVQRGAQQSLEIIQQGQARSIDLPYTSIKPYLSAYGGHVAMIGSNPAEAPAVVTVDIANHEICQVASIQPAAEPRSLSGPEPFSFTARDGLTIHGLYYRPRQQADGPPPPPPLVVKAHPGPTANVPMRLDWHTQYLVSHGFAVAEIDYRGSIGYGRAFRNSLRGAWGNNDALDCTDAAAHLASLGKADPSRTAIWGASAGGYTALRALILTDVFVGGIARSPVIDPRTWRQTAPKFQAHYCDSLIGPWPEAAALYHARSVLENAQAITRPVLLIHGDADPVTPICESRTLAEALGDRAQLVVLTGEGHTWRSEGAVARTLMLELDFLRAITEPAKPV
jgi:dipeptidyl aminopeptidase/acylaminoacyl peptidase